MNDRRLEAILASTSCQRHGANNGEPCWELRLETRRGTGLSACGRRTKEAGFSVPSEPTPRTSHNRRPNKRIVSSKR